MTQTGKSGNSMRWIILLLVSLVIAANYYVYDAMSSIKMVMQTDLGFSNTDYGWLVSFYSFPNTFLLMAIVGGIILDKWGIRKTGFLFISFCVLGIFISAYGVTDYYRAGGFGYDLMKSMPTHYSPELKMLMIGRLFYGLGAETSIVVINKILVRWFKGKELAFAFAINISVARLGTFAALNFSPILGTKTEWPIALWIAALLMGMGFVFYIVYMFMDSKSQKGSLLDADEEFHFNDIFGLFKNKSFIYVIFLCVTFYSAVFPFLAFTPDFLNHKFGLVLYDSSIMKSYLAFLENIFGVLSESQKSMILSGLVASLIPLGTIFFTPVFGKYVDKKGKRASLMFLGSLILFVVHIILATTYLTPYIPMVLLGIAFSLVPAAMWPSVALIVEEKRLGSAYGIMTSLQNLGLWGFPILAGNILDLTNPGITAEALKAGAKYDYTYTILMFAGLGIVGFVFSYLLKRDDKKSGGYCLEKP